MNLQLCAAFDNMITSAAANFKTGGYQITKKLVDESAAVCYLEISCRQMPVDGKDGENRKMNQKKKQILLLSILFCVLFSGCYFSASGSSYDKLSSSRALATNRSQELLSTGSIVESTNIAGGKILRSVFSFTRMEQGGRSSRGVSRIFFSSIFAVLFKIAVIPGMTFAASIDADWHITGAAHRIVLFIHNTDGKKGRRALLPV